ncbi:SusC/RagA family TonB-linked outer membrane protein [Dinghuibacter silviterrae]|uniref:TonB-linked SusC/RagA family outer membrane protein n=1 Tax=Dinghuibacter silviterrae TaxID=1539049 RepID=A0A4R8DG39_9BACT|nr:TonB-dependent receptor [Dinghuibacter silviterrae]TDW96591.1 TonB-linked SusC/RagA family outer membrane protein [Dinghuibacter silviterrae]
MPKLFFPLLLLLCAYVPLQAQTIKVTGTVVSATGHPVSGATIHQKGGSAGAIAADDGSFSIDVRRTKNPILIVTAIGYESTEIKAEETPLKIVLKETSKGLEDVVVVGYGTTRKKDLTGAVASVPMRDADKVPVIGTDQMLEGQVPGVQVTQSQSQPGGTVFSIRIRGTNSINSSSEPLYVVDGFAGADITTINPSDVQSIDILKDASATAIYGSRGANGVVIITTRRGRVGRSLTIEAYTGEQQVTKEYKMMNAQQYGNFLITLQTQQNQLNNTNIPPPYTQAQVNAMGAGTNWQNQIFRVAPVSNMSVGLSGGTEDSKYYLGLNYFDQQGIIIGSDYKRGIVHFNLDQYMGKVHVAVSSQASYGYQDAPTVNTSGGGTTPSVLWDAVRFSPILPVRDSTGAYTYVNGPGPIVSPIGNPVAYANEAQDGNYGLRAFTNVFADYELLRGLHLRSTFGVDYLNGGERKFVPTDLYVAAANGGSASQSSTQNYTWLNENTITYDREFNRIHAINVVGGFTFQHWYQKSFSEGITNLSTNAEGSNNLGVGTPGTPASSYQDNVLSSYFGRLNYRLMDKYLFTFTMRADGSSRFGANNKWGYFPSGAFAWRLSEEPFIRRIKKISDLKLRTSYGVTGNQEIGDYQSLSAYSNNAYSLGGTPTPVVGISPSNIPNPSLSWESTAAFDAGLDLGLWNNRVTFTGDFYYKKTSNLLLNVSIPQTSGYSSILENSGAVQNEGFEFGINSRNIETHKVKWSTYLNFSTNRNKVLSLGSNQQIYAGDLSSSIFPSATFKSGILLVGKPIGSFYGYVFNGIWQTSQQIAESGTKQAVQPGDPIYKDLNGDSLINGSDRTIIGHALPKFTYGMTNTITYGRFTLNVFIQGVYGNNIFDENLYEVQNGSNNFNRLAYIGTESWTGPGTSNTLPRVSSVLRRSMGVTSDVIKNGSYLRFKTVTLSYELPLPKMTAVFKSASVYATVQNLATITSYPGYDPEVNSFPTSNALSLGTDYNAYPNYRTYLVGVRFGF